MKISVSFDFGDDLCSPFDIKVSANIETTLKDCALIPNVREVIAGGIEPILRYLHMNERRINEEVENILHSGEVYSGLDFPYYYDLANMSIRSHIDKDVRYSIKDFAEGKLPASQTTKTD